MKQIEHETITICCGSPSTRNTVSLRFIRDEDGYKIYQPFNGCDFMCSRPECNTCIPYVWQKLLRNEIDPLKPIYIPMHP